MTSKTESLFHRVAELAERQPFTVHWQFQPLVPAGGGTEQAGPVGQGAAVPLASFSTRKVSLLLAALALVQRGELRLDQRLTVTEAMKEGVQAGIMKDLAPGVELSLEDHLRQMMITSDNICTQLVFEAIGEATGDSLKWVNDYCSQVGLTGTIHREVFPRSGDLEWDHGIDQMTVTTAADQTELLAKLGQGAQEDAVAADLMLSPEHCRFAIRLMRELYTPLLGADTGTVTFAEKNGRGLRGLSQVGLALGPDGAPIAAVAVFAEGVPPVLPDGRPGRLAAYELFGAVGRAVEVWHTGVLNPLGETHSAAAGTRAGSVPVDGESFACAFSALHSHTQPGSPRVGTDGPDPQTTAAAEQPHPLAGVGKLFAALALAERASGEPELLKLPVTITGRHRQQAILGPLRTHTGDLTLSLGDALSLIVGTADAAAALAVRETLTAHGIDLAAEAQELVTRLHRARTPLVSTRITGMEDAEGSQGDLLLGRTTAEDLMTLLTMMVRCGGLIADAAERTLAPGAAAQVLEWMAQVFEPDGLTYALPGYGPKKVPQWSVSAGPLRSPSSPEGWASVMISRPELAGGVPGLVCAAAHIPAGGGNDGRTARRVTERFGHLGLAAHHGCR